METVCAIAVELGLEVEECRLRLYDLINADETYLTTSSFQVLPVFVRATQGLVTLQAFGSLALLLVWIYVMANVLVLGAEVNWYLARGR